jgi:hypothetical protein
MLHPKPILILACLLSLFFCMFVAATFVDRGHYTGDGASNDVVVISGRNFADLGFIKLRFGALQVPMQKAPDLPVDPKNSPFYFHYPSGMDLMQGVLFKLGLSSRFSHQLFALALSFLGAFFAWKTLLLLFEPWPAAIAWSVFVLAPNFIFFADSLHMHSYFFLIKWLFFYFIAQLYTLNKKGTTISSRSWFLNFFGLGIVGSFFSLDLVPPTLVLGISLLFCVPKEKRWTAGLLLMMAAPIGEIIGFTLQLYKNSFVLGNFSLAVQDFLEIFKIRAGLVTGENLGGQYNFSKHIVKFFLGTQWFFTWPLLIVALWGWFTSLKKRDSFWNSLFLASVIGTFFWAFFMRQHSMIHAFTYRHTETFAVVGLALFIQSLSKKYWATAGFICLLFISVHSALGVFQIEGTSLKRVVIQDLIPEESRESWACAQSPRLKESTELPGAKTIVGELIKPDQSDLCQGHSQGLRDHLAELILFWR